MEKFAIPGAGALIVKEEDGEKYVLLQERWKEKAPEENGMLEIPAGKVREFESIYDTLRREVLEETGLDIVEIYGEDQTLLYSHGQYRVINFTPFACSQNLAGKYPIMVFVFICKAEGDLLGSSDESKNYKWMTMGELGRRLEADPQGFYPMHVGTLQKFVTSTMK
ncbi:NUDIX domain-containing protein [Ruminococcaceae bacterium OttesenSCG-928-A11]|nr:NUDIX domain-containing protein [Ruminococcaceae bacterium OttesenSCG-928-A11]